MEYQIGVALSTPALSQSGEISPDFCCFDGGGIRHNEDIMHSFQNFIVRLIPNHPPPLETRIWKLVVRALLNTYNRFDDFLKHCYQCSPSLSESGKIFLGPWFCMEIVCTLSVNRLLITFNIQTNCKLTYVN